MHSVVLVIGSHLCRNHRAVRAASALAAAGWDVTVLGPRFSDQHAAEDDELLRRVDWAYRVTVDLRPQNAGRLRRLLLRAGTRLSTEGVHRLGLQLPGALGYGVGRTIDIARNSTSDLLIGYQEIGALVAHRLGLEGRRVGADFEDWYSRDQLPAANLRRPLKLLRDVESWLLRNASYTATTSHAMAAAMANACGSKTPLVVYNVFEWSDRAFLDSEMRDRIDAGTPSLHWVSQTIGPGRGLELLFEALERIPQPIELHLRGHCSDELRGKLESMFHQRVGHSLFIHPPVPARELLSRIAEHDIGLALELTQPESRNLTVTYKTFHYLTAGLSVLASATAGQSEVARLAPGAVVTFDCGDAASLATALQELIRSPERLSQAKTEALRAAHDLFCWERQAPLLCERMRASVV